MSRMTTVTPDSAKARDSVEQRWPAPPMTAATLPRRLKRSSIVVIARAPRLCAARRDRDSLPDTIRWLPPPVAVVRFREMGEDAVRDDQVERAVFELERRAPAVHDEPSTRDTLSRAHDLLRDDVAARDACLRRQRGDVHGQPAAAAAEV